MSQLVVVEHPLVKHHLTTLRSESTPSAEFRRCLHRLALLLSYEATKDLSLSPRAITTPVALMVGHAVEQRLGLVPILRAGLGMVDPILTLLPDAEVWHLGVYRDEKTLLPVEYYKKLRPRHPVDVALILDPMLATGGSAIAAIEAMQDWGVGTVKFLSIIASPEGINRVTERAPGISVYVCAIDEKLNEHGYIVPGLGDAGDRTFNAQAAT